MLRGSINLSGSLAALFKYVCVMLARGVFFLFRMSGLLFVFMEDVLLYSTVQCSSKNIRRHRLY